MENVIINNRKAGFWVRFAATWVDLFIAWAAVKLIIAIFYQRVIKGVRLHPQVVHFFPIP